MENTEVHSHGAHSHPSFVRNAAWTSLAVIVTVLLALSIFGAVYDVVVDGSWLSVLGLPIVVLVWFWVAEIAPAPVPG